MLGPDNAKVGDVSDVLFEKGGKILGLIVGVGGFLGIGEKNVAIDMSAFEVVPASTGSSTRRDQRHERSDQRQAQGVVDQGPAQERAGLPVLQAAGAHDAGRDVADHRHGAADQRPPPAPR